MDRPPLTQQIACWMPLSLGAGPALEALATYPGNLTGYLARCLVIQQHKVWRFRALGLPPVLDQDACRMIEIQGVEDPRWDGGESA